MKRNTGYHVFLFGERFWHRTLEGAGRRLTNAQNWCNGEYAQCIEITTGQDKTDEAWDAL